MVLCACVFGGRVGSEEAWNAYRARRMNVITDDSLQDWKHLPATYIQAGAQVDLEASENLSNEQHGRGKRSGNVCGYYAACRVAAMYGKRLPKVGHVFSTLFTTPKELANFINEDTSMSAARTGFRTEDYFAYLGNIRQAINAETPVVVLFCLGSIFKMHYVVVVGYHPVPGDTEGRADFLVLDYHGVYHVTENEFYRLSYNPAPFHRAYNTIEVTRK
jgi:hypothetical protein